MTFLCGLDGNQFATRIELDACTHERKGRVMKRCDCELIDNGSGKPVAKSLAFTMFDAGFVPGEKTTTVLTADLAQIEARAARLEAALRELAKPLYKRHGTLVGYKVVGATPAQEAELAEVRRLLDVCEVAQMDYLHDAALAPPTVPETGGGG